MHLFTHLSRSCWTVIVTMHLRGCLFCTEGHFALWQHKHAWRAIRSSPVPRVVHLCRAARPRPAAQELGAAVFEGLGLHPSEDTGMIEGRGSKATARRMRQEKGLVDEKRS